MIYKQQTVKRKRQTAQQPSQSANSKSCRKRQQLRWGRQKKMRSCSKPRKRNAPRLGKTGTGRQCTGWPLCQILLSLMGWDQWRCRMWFSSRIRWAEAQVGTNAGLQVRQGHEKGYKRNQSWWWLAVDCGGAARRISALCSAESRLCLQNWVAMQSIWGPNWGRGPRLQGWPSLHFRGRHMPG